jgi:hypothetical protein
MDCDTVWRAVGHLFDLAYPVFQHYVISSAVSNIKSCNLTAEDAKAAKSF